LADFEMRETEKDEKKRTFREEKVGSMANTGYIPEIMKIFK